MTSVSKLEIRLLGPVDFAYNGASIKITRRTERAILYYLAVENRPVSRTELIDVLWPQAEQVNPRGSLRTAISRLRKSLPDKDLLKSEHDQVALDISRCKIDELLFEDSYQSLQGILSALSTNEPLPIQIVKQISDSLNLWQGERVLQDEDFSTYPALGDWHQRLHMKLSQHREILTRRLANHHQANGHLEQAMDLFIQLGRINFLDQASHLAVLEILIKLGRHQEALEFCDALEVIYEREYNAPLPDELIQRCRYSQQLLEESLKRPGQDWPIPLSMQYPLVGRTTELAKLMEAFFRGGLVKIEGVMGVGKTRLVKELFETLSPKPLLFLAQARESESALPLAPIIHGLRRHIPEEIWQSIEGVWANQLSILLPELIEIRPDCSPTMAGKITSASQYLFDALHHLFRHAAKRYGRILFFLDDAQWVDRQTAAALSYLVMQGFFDENGVLIIATRLRELSADIEMVFDQQQRTGQVEVLTLNGFTPEELKNLVQLMLNQPPSPSFIDVLYQQTNGIPFWALEVVRHLLDAYGDIQALQNVSRFPLIESAHAFFLSQLFRFSQDSRYLIACAAVIGTEISIPLLKSVSDLSQHDFLLALDPLIQTDILRLNPAVNFPEERLTFTNEIFREVVITETNAAHRKMLHQRIAEALSKASDSTVMAAIIAEHFKAAGDMENGFEWLLNAAAHAWVLGASKDVIWSYQQAEELLVNTPGDFFTVNHIFNLYHQWSNYAYQFHQASILEEVGIKLQQFTHKDPGCLLMGLSNLILAMGCFLREDFETGMLLSQKAAKDLERENHPEAFLQALFLQGLFGWWLLDFDRVFTLADRMLNLLKIGSEGLTQQPIFQFIVERMICDAYYAQGEAKKVLHQAQEVFQEFYNNLGTFDQYRAHLMMTYAYFISGYFKECTQHAQESLNIAQMLDNQIVEVLSLIILSKVEINLGYLDNAFQHAARALQIAQVENKIQFIVAANTLLGDIFIILHDYTRSMQYYRMAQVRQGYFFQSYYGLENNIHLARLLIWTDQDEEALEIINATLEVTEQKQIMLLHAQALILAGLLDLRKQNYTDAEKNLVTAIDIAEKKGLIHEALWGKFIFACLVFAKMDFDRVKQILTEVLEGAEAQGMALMSISALGLFSRLSKVKVLLPEQDTLRALFYDRIDEIDAQTQSEPLREAFLKAKQIWQEGGPFP